MRTMLLRRRTFHASCRADGGTALWEGRSRFTATANSGFADTQAAATRLADALFGGFPGQSGETIEVE